MAHFKLGNNRSIHKALSCGIILLFVLILRFVFTHQITSTMHFCVNLQFVNDHLHSNSQNTTTEKRRCNFVRKAESWEQRNANQHKQSIWRKENDCWLVCDYLLLTDKSSLIMQCLWNTDRYNKSPHRKKMFKFQFNQALGKSKMSFCLFCKKLFIILKLKMFHI